MINATPVGLNGGDGPLIDFTQLPPGCVIMDMVYRPLRTLWLTRATDAGLRTVDGLAMLIGQAAPSFTAIFERPVPDIDVRTLALQALETR